MLGVACVMLQPLLPTLIFTLVFGNLLRVPSNGLPFPGFAFAARLPWNCFAIVLNRSGTGLVNKANLRTKIYFPECQSYSRPCSHAW